VGQNKKIMGLNIYPCILLDRADGGRIKTERFKDFETQRHTGDVEFYMTNDLEWDT